MSRVDRDEAWRAIYRHVDVLDKALYRLRATLPHLIPGEAHAGASASQAQASNQKSASSGPSTGPLEVSNLPEGGYAE